jgi:hypothetical protein
MNTSTDEARAALIAAAVLSLFSTVASAQVHPEKPTYNYEKCRPAAARGTVESPCGDGQGGERHRREQRSVRF